MEITLRRVAIVTKDLHLLLGKSMRSCQREMQLIRDMFALDRQKPVTVFHVAEYLDMPVSDIAVLLKLNR